MTIRNRISMIAAAGSRVLLALSAVVGAGATFAAEPTPVAEFFKRPTISSAVVSPSGQYAAVTVTGGKNRRQNLVVVDLRAPSKMKAVAGYADADVTEVHWVNDDRLVFGLDDNQVTEGQQYGQGLFSVDREGKETARNLIERGGDWSKSESRGEIMGSRITNSRLTAFHHLHSLLRDGSNDVILAKWNVVNDLFRYRLTGTTLWRLDTNTGSVRALTLGAPESVRWWAVDRNGLARAAVNGSEGKSRLYWKAATDGPWALVMETDTYGADARIPFPLSVDGNDILYLAARLSKEADTESLLRVDLSKKPPDIQSLMSLEGYDFGAGLADSSLADESLVLGSGGQVLGIRFLADARGTEWIDPALKEIQQKVNRLLPGAINRIDCGLCKNPAVMLVKSWSDRQPVVYRAYDNNAGTLTVLFASRPTINQYLMAKETMVRIDARDGSKIPLRLSRPNGQSAPAPTVVLIHDGPYDRGAEWEWDAQSQFLASRGYVVVEPEFRGSYGFGFRHFQAGWKQWGLAMQDDIADATTWAVKQGYADPKRICVAGPGYGGYATLMGLIRYPELYRCGVAWVGITDLDMLYSARYPDARDIYAEYGMPVLIGDRDKDAKQLAETSPAKLASKLTQPLLMAYGDLGVAIRHGAAVRDGVAAHNKNLEWVTYTNEAYSWNLEANHIDFWTRVEKFLDKHLKNAQ